MDDTQINFMRRLLLQGAVASAVAAAAPAGAQSAAAKRDAEGTATGPAKRNPGEISPLMRTLSSYIAEAGKSTLPEAITEATKHHLLDTLAAMVSGTHLLPGKRAIAYVKKLGGTPEACIPGTRIMTNVVNAALTGGMLAQADETDDTHPLAGVHLGACVVPPALAIAERGHVGGTALLRAVALGYDVGTRLSLALGGSKFSIGGNDPATVKNRGSFGGVFGAAAACASLAGLNLDQIRYVLSYTGQQASGLSNFAQDLEHIE